MEIHADQLVVMHAEARRSFADELAEHVRRFFPGHRALPPAATRALVDLAVTRAQARGFTSERNICLYLDLMVMLGAGFEADPQVPWAAEILGDPRHEHPTLRIDALTNAALGHLDRAAGPDDEHLRAALLRMRREMADMIDMVDRSGGTWPDIATAVLWRIWPERCAEVGDAALAATIRGAYAAAQRHGLAARHDLAIYLVCAFLYGSGFAEDPQYPWAAAALAARAGDGARRAERLYHEGLACLARMLELEEVRS